VLWINDGFNSEVLWSFWFTFIKWTNVISSLEGFPNGGFGGSWATNNKDRVSDIKNFCKLYAFEDETLISLESSFFCYIFESVVKYLIDLWWSNNSWEKIID
jgi:hypothetical protein